ncbi:MAG: hypothetical protein AAF849_16380 [Bacteroidota bacterium]
MEKTLIKRIEEQQVLQKALQSNKAELITTIGRRVLERLFYFNHFIN